MNASDDTGIAALVAALRRTLALLPEGHAPASEAAAATAALERLNAQLEGEPRSQRRREDVHPLRGRLNPIAPPLSVELGEDAVRGSVTCSKAYEGPRGSVQGGSWRRCSTACSRRRRDWPAAPG